MQTSDNTILITGGGQEKYEQTFQGFNAALAAAAGH